MAKTELTRQIEQAIIGWHPAKIGDIAINSMRSEHTALEVVAARGTTSEGIIDAVRVSEYFGDYEYRHVCAPSCWRREGIRLYMTCEMGHDPQAPLPAFCEHTSCQWNRTKQVGTQKILLTCFEIKVTKSDFKSEHGHNFVGNMNYYAVPEEIFKEIEPLVAPEIGILVYYHNGKYTGLRTKRKAAFKDMSHEDQKWMILSVMNRIRDMDRRRYIEAQRKGEGVIL